MSKTIHIPDPFKPKPFLDQLYDKLMKDSTDPTSLSDLKQVLLLNVQMQRQLIQVLTPDSTYDTLSPIQELFQLTGGTSNGTLLQSRDNFTITINLVVLSVESGLATTETTIIRGGGSVTKVTANRRDLFRITFSSAEPTIVIPFPEPLTLFPDEDLLNTTTGGIATNVARLFVFGRYRSTSNVDFRNVNR